MRCEYYLDIFPSRVIAFTTLFRLHKVDLVRCPTGKELDEDDYRKHNNTSRQHTEKNQGLDR